MSICAFIISPEWHKQGSLTLWLDDLEPLINQKMPVSVFLYVILKPKEWIKLNWTCAVAYLCLYLWHVCTLRLSFAEQSAGFASACLDGAVSQSELWKLAVKTHTAGEAACRHCEDYLGSCCVVFLLSLLHKISLSDTDILTDMHTHNICVLQVLGSFFKGVQQKNRKRSCSKNLVLRQPCVKFESHPESR